MANIDKLIQDLKSDNPGIRYQACNLLFYESSIPENAIEALQIATQDSDPVVADVAKRAINIHTIESSKYASSNEEEISGYDSKSQDFVQNIEEERTREKRLMLISMSAAFSGITAFFTSFFLWSNSEGYIEASIWVPVSPLFLFFISIGAAIVATLVNIAIASRLFGRIKNALLIIFSIVTGIVIGSFAGYFCNLWR